MTSKEELANAWAEGAQFAWEKTGEGWNHEYANGNDAHPVFPDLDQNPYSSDTVK